MFQRLLEQIALSLEALRIPYMVIGGQALLLYGEPRLTRDIDVALGVGAERLADLLRLAADRSWRVLVDSPADFVRKTMVLPCLEPASGIRLDFIFSFSVYEQQAMERVRRVPLGKTDVSFASVEDLLIHKIVAGRPRDLEDVRSIVSKDQPIDLSYVRHWLEQFNRGLGEDLLKRFEGIWTAARGGSSGRTISGP